MNFIPLPPELSGLEGRVQWVHQVNYNELHMSCPSCGIQPHHSDSHPSDRFIVWLESRMNGKPFGLCRTCGWKWSNDKQDAVWTDEEKAAFAAKRRELNQREEQRIREYATNVVMKQRVYDKYADIIKHSTYGREWLSRRRLNAEWVEYLKIGIFEDYKCRGYNSTYYSPAITMPVWGLESTVENVKLRVTEAKHEKDRFRNLYKTNAQHPYFPNRDEKITGGKVAFFEGEMKSIAVAMYGYLPNDVQIIGSQGKGIGSRLVYMVENCEVVYLCLDPDTFLPNEKGDTTIMQTARKIGYNRVRIIPVKQKVDDAIFQGFNLLNAFNMAVKPSQLGLKQ